MAALRPYERNVGLLFQDYALFPHMTVAQNIMYGMRRRHMPRNKTAQQFERVIQLVKLNGYEKRMPGQLSGGQQQRVALARSLAIEPEVMLLDEPLSALDAKLRQDLRTELKEILGAVGSTTIVVTHDQEEAMSMSDRIFVMNAGRIVQSGVPSEIYDKPATKFVAEFLGRSNWFSVTGTRRAGSNLVECAIEGGGIVYSRRSVPGSPDIALCVRPERVRLMAREATASLDPFVNAFHGTVADVALLGSEVHILLALERGGRLLAVAPNAGRVTMQLGDAITASVAAEDCILVEA